MGGLAITALGSVTGVPAGEGAGSAAAEGLADAVADAEGSVEAFVDADPLDGFAAAGPRLGRVGGWPAELPTDVPGPGAGVVLSAWATAGARHITVAAATAIVPIRKFLLTVSINSALLFEP